MNTLIGRLHADAHPRLRCRASDTVYVRGEVMPNFHRLRSPTRLTTGRTA